MTISCFCAFEGGGAKGLAHLSTLSGLDRESDAGRILVRGYAGTSAGAIVAALAAAGFRSKDLLEHNGKPARSPALEAIGKSDTPSLFALFGQWSRFKLQLLRGLFWLFGARWRRWVLSITAVLLLVASLLGATGATIITLFVLAFFVWVWFRHFRGLVDLVEIEQLIGKLLQHKLGVSDAPITFRRMRELSGVDLAVIAANLEGAKLVRFDADETPDISVAQAVTASAAIPIVFKPVVIAGKSYCDGGIVSNLPAWVFDDLLVIEPGGLVVTSEIVGPAQKARPAGGGLRLVGRVIWAGLFGARVLETRGLRNHLPLKLDTGEIKTLDFSGTPSHLPILEKLDPVIESSIREHVIAMQLADLRHAFYGEHVRGLLGEEADRICLVLLKRSRTDGGAPRGFRAWHGSGPRDCRWHPFIESITQASDTGQITWGTATEAGDADWCVAIPGERDPNAVILCLGNGAAERLPEIARLLGEANSMYPRKFV